MKSPKYLTYAAIAVLAATSSCNKLDEYNPANATSDAVWNTPAGFLTAVNGAYHEMHNWFGREDGLFMSESGTDLWYVPGKGTYARQLAYYDALTPASGNPNINSWKAIWKGVNACNAAIGRIDGAGYKTEVEKNQRLGELRFLRALYYLQIVETWGNVALRDKEVSSADLSASRSTIPELYDFMISDLLFAKDALPNTWGAEYSRATKKSALGILARTYLTRASYETGAAANPWYTKARDVAAEIIARKTELGTDLWPTITDLWKADNNPNNKESLFTISYSLAYINANYNADANKAHNWFTMNYTKLPALKADVIYGRDNERRLMPTLHLLDLFTESIDARYEGCFQETWVANGTPHTWNDANRPLWNKTAGATGTINVGDLAVQLTKQVIADKQTVKHVCLDRNDLYKPDRTINVTWANYYPVLKKFLDPKMPDATKAPGYNDLFVMRFAEVYLIAGEAEWRLGNSAAAVNYFNVIRERAAKSGQAAAMRIDASVLSRDWILDERARELCGEFGRWFDVKRMIKENNGTDWANYIKAKNPDITAVQPFMQLRPIPLVELNSLENGADFGQNGGYQ